MRYVVDDDRDRIDADTVWEFLSQQAYWGRWRTRADVGQQLRGAWRLVGAYDESGAMVAFARAVSDGVAVAYLADVFVLPEHRGAGIGDAVIRRMVDEGPGAHFRWMLHTADAHGFYARHGFTRPDATYLERPSTAVPSRSEPPDRAGDRSPAAGPGHHPAV